ncbi:MAG: hypothetical protein CVV53_04160 [Spirochaetae bacterium HGW-Spirochaetae-9]|nr:MAG: hypothetical protein CVV53_04160 [Spirochaetae bacterium HGW-Spirochaetae-9]
MKKKDSFGRDSLSWAGSNPGTRHATDSLLAGSTRQDIYKLHEMRHKLNDDTYVDGAVNRIASFLTSTLKKKENDEQ